MFENDAVENWKNYLRRNKSLIVDMFQGQLRNTCKCLKCGHVNIRFEPFMYLSLPITNKCKSVDDCMDLYLKEEDLTGADQYYCEKCKDQFTQEFCDASDELKLIVMKCYTPDALTIPSKFGYQLFSIVESTFLENMDSIMVLIKIIGKCPNNPKSLWFWWKKASMGVRSPWINPSGSRHVLTPFKTILTFVKGVTLQDISVNLLSPSFWALSISKIWLQTFQKIQESAEFYFTWLFLHTYFLTKLMKF